MVGYIRALSTPDPCTWRSPRAAQEWMGSTRLRSQLHRVPRVGPESRFRWWPMVGAPELPGMRPVASDSEHRGKASAELLGQSDDDALRPTQEAEPVDVLVLRDLADELGTVVAQAGNDVVDVADSEHDAA